MRNKTLVVSTSDINTGTVQEINLVEQIPFENRPSAFKTVTPSEMRLYNRTGCDLEYLLISDDLEWAEYQADPSLLFDFIRLTDGMWAHHHPMEKAIKLLVRRKSGTATADLDVELIGYANRG